VTTDAGTPAEAWVPMCRSCVKTAAWNRLRREAKEEPCVRCAYGAQWRSLESEVASNAANETLKFMDQISYGLRPLRFKDPDDVAIVEGARLVEKGRKVRFSFTIADGHITDIKAVDAGPLIEKADES